MKIKRIEHVGVVVRDLEASRSLWEDCFGIPLRGIEENAKNRLKLSFYPVGESMVELIAGTTSDSKYSKLVAEGKGGLNHICFEVENIDEALAELKAKGIPLLDQVARTGHEGCRIAFLDPTGTENCLIELAELPAGWQRVMPNVSLSISRPVSATRSARSRATPKTDTSGRRSAR